MPAPYRGRVIIECGEASCKFDKSRENVGVDCLACECSKQAVVDLDDKTIGYLKKPEAVRAVERKTTRKTKEE
jgi:hypothetical protein